MRLSKLIVPILAIGKFTAGEWVGDNVVSGVCFATPEWKDTKSTAPQLFMCLITPCDIETTQSSRNSHDMLQRHLRDRSWRCLLRQRMRSMRRARMRYPQGHRRGSPRLLHFKHHKQQQAVLHGEEGSVHRGQ